MDNIRELNFNDELAELSKPILPATDEQMQRFLQSGLDYLSEKSFVKDKNEELESNVDDNEFLNDKIDATYVKVPQYNSLDKDPIGKTTSKTMPFTKEVVSIDELRKTKKTSMGVIPIRESLKITELNVMMQGDNIERVNPKKERSKPHRFKHPSPKTSVPSKRFKPAIVSTLGTSSVIPIMDRPKPPSRPISHFSKKSSRSTKSRSTPRLAAVSREVNILDDSGMEAENELSSDAETTARQPTPPPIIPQRTERTVDEIIADLREIQKTGPVVSESDAKINGILERIKLRSNIALGQLPAAQPEEESSSDESLSGVPEVETDNNESRNSVRYSPSNNDAGSLPSTVRATTRSSRDIQQSVHSVGDELLSSRPLDPMYSVTDETEIPFSAAKKVMAMPITVNPSDVVNITGTASNFHPRRNAAVRTKEDNNLTQANITSKSVSFVSSQKPCKKVILQIPEKTSRIDHPSMHQFCLNQKEEDSMDFHLKYMSYALHVPRKFGFAPIIYPSTQMNSLEKEPGFENRASSAQEKRYDDAAQRVMNEYEKTLENWKDEAEAVLDQKVDEMFSVMGSSVQFADPKFKQFLVPIHPKLELPPGHIQENLFKNFTSSVLEPQENMQIADQQSLLEDLDSDEDQILVRYDIRRVASDSNILEISKREKEARLSAEEESELLEKKKAIEEQVRKEEEIKQAEKEAILAGRRPAKDPKVENPALQNEVSEIKKEEIVLTEEEIFWAAQKSRHRRYSHPNIHFDSFAATSSDTANLEECFQEVAKQRDFLLHTLRDQKEETPSETSEEFDSRRTSLKTVTFKDINANKEDAYSTTTAELLQDTPDESMSRAEKSRQVALNLVRSPKKLKQGEKQFPNLRKLFLKTSGQPRRLERSESLPKIRGLIRPKHLIVSRKIRHRRTGSFSNDVTFEDFLNRFGYYSQSDSPNPYDFAFDKWFDWFDELYPPLDKNHELSLASHGSASRTSMLSAQSRGTPSEAEHSLADIQSITNNKGCFIKDEQRIILEEKLQELNEKIERREKTLTYDLLSRAVIYRKLGRVKDSWDDVNRVIEREPNYVDAFWNRHLIFVIQGKLHSALEDLTYIIKVNKQHASAYRAKGDIYRMLNDTNMSIFNYSQAIKLNAQDHMAFYYRAEMYREKREMLLANEDYATAAKLCSTLTDAKFKHGLYYFNSGNFQAAIFDFNELLKQNPNDAKARLYRGRCFAKTANWTKAVEDISAAIHLNPLDYMGFYYRGCMLRRQYPMNAIQDFSVSLLLDDSYDNRLAFLHRGLIYMSLERFDDALLDFESVLQLDKTVALAHCNMGIIYLTRMFDYPRAIRKFTDAIRTEPTYIRAYVCRGEAFEKSKKHRDALHDYTRAIFMEPLNINHYLARGRVLLSMGYMDLAALTIRQIAEIADMDKMPLNEQSIIFSFLKQFDKCVKILVKVARIKPVPSVLAMLGQAEMKAKKFTDAINSFSKALEVLTPMHHKQEMPKESSEVYFNMGICYLEILDNKKAFESFSKSIRIKPNIAATYNYRGIARFRLNQMKPSIYDFNKALSLHPKMWEAYLNRSCYYAHRGRYSKAILSCNEAIRIRKDCVRAYLYRGSYKFVCHQFKNALADFNAAIQLDHGCTLAFFNQAIVFHALKEYELSLKNYSTVLLLDETIKQKVLINRGLLYFEMQDYKNSMQDFHEAFKENPQGAKIGHTLGLCYHKQREFQKAIDAFSDSIQADQFCLDAYIGRGNVYMDLGTEYGFKMAKRDYGRALMLEPHCFPARVNTAYCLQVSGKFAQAWRQFTVVIQKNPNFQAALEGRAVVNLQMGESFAALQDMNAALHIKHTAELLTNRGVIHQFIGDKVNAMRDYQAAIKLDSRFSLAYYNAANVYFHNRQFRQAKEYYDQALAFDAKDECAFMNRAISKVMLRDSGGALDDFNSSISLNPQAAHAYFNRGNLFASLKNYQEAETDFSQALKYSPNDPLSLKRRADMRGKLSRKQEAINDYKMAIDVKIKLENISLIPNANIF